MVHYTRERVFEIQADAERIWPVVANTNLISELVGQGTYEAVDELQPDGSVLRRASGSTKLRPFATRWTEDLGEWVYARYCRQHRSFGPDDGQHLDYSAWLEPAGEATCLRVQIDIAAGGAIPWIGDKLGIINRVVDKILAIQIALIDADLARRASDGDPLTDLPYAPPPQEPEVKRRLEEAHRTLRRLSGDAGVADKIVDFLARAPVDFLNRIRPLELARVWHADPHATVDGFLAAHRAGLVALKWEVLCPSCRNSRDPAATLDDLPRTVHCSTCNVDYERDFSRNVELLFSPEPWLRQVPPGAACMLGASTTPHIVIQRHVAPGEELVIDPPLHPGGYRVRAPQIESRLEFDWDGADGFPSLVARDGVFEQGPPSADGAIRLRNERDARVTFVVEELAWRSDALTGDQAIARAAFRRYCPDQLLRPGDEVSISNVVLMFTDLKGSTSLYEAIGDAAAYKLVRDHFDYLTGVVEAHQGTVVKTMGDAIMAAFSDAAEAVAAALELQSGVAKFNAGRADGGVVLKLGLHRGACIAVTADGKLDYFGSMVNLAARLQGQSHGGDIVLSRDLVESVDTAQLAAAESDYEQTEESGALRGIEHPVAYCRLTLRAEPAAAPPGYARQA